MSAFDPFISNNSNFGQDKPGQPEKEDQSIISSFNDIEDICKSYDVSPFMKLLIPFIYWTTDIKDSFNDNPKSYKEGYSSEYNAYTSFYQTFKKFGNLDLTAYSKLIFQYIPNLSAAPVSLDDLISADLSKLELNMLLKFIYSMCYSGFTRFIHDLKYIYAHYAKNQISEQMYADTELSPEDSRPLKIQMYRIMSTMKYLTRYQRTENIPLYYNFFCKNYNMYSPQSDTISAIFEKGMFGNILNNFKPGYNMGYCMRDFTTILSIYLIIVTKSIFGNSVITDFNTKSKDEFHKIILSSPVNIMTDANMKCYIICCTLFNRCREYLVEQNAFYSDNYTPVDDSGNNNLENKLSNYLNCESEPVSNIARCVTEILRIYSEHDQNIKENSNACYNLWKRSSHFSYTCPAHLSLLPEKSVHDFALTLSDRVYSSRGLDLIHDACRALRISAVSSDQYVNFLSEITGCFESDCIGRISRYIKIFISRDFDNISDLFDKDDIMYPEAKHSQVFVYNHIFNTLCLLASNKQFTSMTYLENIISHTVSDYIILLLINSKFKEEAATRPVTNLVELLIVYISSISAGFSILINSYRFCNNNVPVNLSYGDGDLILVNLFNICAKTQYRCQRLPAFKYQKEQIIPNEFFYGISGFNTGMDENLAIIINRANQSEKYPPSPSTVYKNMINYLSSAICENAITSEVVIMMMLRLFKEDTQRTLSLKDKFDSIDEMHPFRDLMQGIVKQMAHRDTNFFSLFHLENKDKNFLYVISNNFIKDTEKCAELQEKIEPFLEAIVFITILQNIVMSFEFNGAFNAKYRDVFLFVTDDQKNTIGNMDFIHSSGSRFPNNNTTIFEAVTEDIRTAVALLESVVSQNINEPNPHIEHVSGIESEFKPLDMKNIRKSSQDLNRYFQSLLT